MLRLLYVLDRGCNTGYLSQCIQVLHKSHRVKARVVSLREYLTNDWRYDALIYQTFPCDRIDSATGKYHPKYDHDTIIQTDLKFAAARGLKLLYDANDGCDDGFSRLSAVIPRIKNCPTSDDYRAFNIVMATTHPIEIVPKRAYTATETICYCGISYHSNPIRAVIREAIQDLPNVRMDEIPKRQYRDFLATSAIIVCPPGYSQTTFRHLQALNSGRLMFAMPGLARHRLLPYADLIPGEDYVEFQVDQLRDLLEKWTVNKGDAIRIGQNGQTKFYDGYSIDRAASELLGVLKEGAKCGK